MRIVFCIIVFYQLAALISCKPKYSVHNVVYTSEQNKASDEVFIDYLTRQIANDPEEVANYLKLAEIYQKQGKAEKAFDILQKGEAENPQNVELLIGKQPG